MRSWPRPEVPSLPGTARPLRLYDTATDEISPTAPGRTARIYVCGITPYDATHLGHAATYLAFDLVQRMWLDAGHDVHYVQNITDVDDPLLERATATGISWQELAEREIELFRQDMTSLRVLPPRDYIGVVEAVDEIAEAVAKLLADEKAYRLEDDIYATLEGSGHFGYESALLRRARCSPSSPSGAATRTGRASGIRSMRCCGAGSGRASRPGRRRWGRADRAGMSSALPSPATGSAWGSTCRAAEPTCAFRTMNIRPRMPRR